MTINCFERLECAHQFTRKTCRNYRGANPNVLEHSPTLEAANDKGYGSFTKSGVILFLSAHDDIKCATDIVERMKPTINQRAGVRLNKQNSYCSIEVPPFHSKVKTLINGSFHSNTGLCPENVNRQTAMTTRDNAPR